MATFLFIRGMEPVEIDANFNLVRHRINQAITGTTQDGSKADDKTRNRPLHKLTFKTIVRDEDGDVIAFGRIAPTPDNVIGVGSDEEKDEGGPDEDAE